MGCGASVGEALHWVWGQELKYLYYFRQRRTWDQTNIAHMLGVATRHGVGCSWIVSGGEYQNHCFSDLNQTFIYHYWLSTSVLNLLPINNWFIRNG